MRGRRIQACELAPASPVPPNRHPGESWDLPVPGRSTRPDDIPAFAGMTVVRGGTLQRKYAGRRLPACELASASRAPPVRHPSESWDLPVPGRSARPDDIPASAGMTVVRGGTLRRKYAGRRIHACELAPASRAPPVRHPSESWDLPVPGRSTRHNDIPAFAGMTGGAPLQEIIRVDVHRHPNLRRPVELPQPFPDDILHIQRPPRMD